MARCLYVFLSNKACDMKDIAYLIKQGGNSKYVQKNTPKTYGTKEFFSYVLLFWVTSL
jgi:hypothetical protein